MCSLSRNLFSSLLPNRFSFTFFFPQVKTISVPTNALFYKEEFGHLHGCQLLYDCQCWNIMSLTLSPRSSDCMTVPVSTYFQDFSPPGRRRKPDTWPKSTPENERPLCFKILLFCSPVTVGVAWVINLFLPVWYFNIKGKPFAATVDLQLTDLLVSGYFYIFFLSSHCIEQNIAF